MNEKLPETSRNFQETSKKLFNKKNVKNITIKNNNSISKIGNFQKLPMGGINAQGIMVRHFLHKMIFFIWCGLEVSWGIIIFIGFNTLKGQKFLGSFLEVSKNFQ